MKIGQNFDELGKCAFFTKIRKLKDHYVQAVTMIIIRFVKDFSNFNIVISVTYQFEFFLKESLRIVPNS